MKQDFQPLVQRIHTAAAPLEEVRAIMQHILEGVIPDVSNAGESDKLPSYYKTLAYALVRHGARALMSEDRLETPDAWKSLAEWHNNNAAQHGLPRVAGQFDAVRDIYLFLQRCQEQPLKMQQKYQKYRATDIAVYASGLPETQEDVYNSYRILLWRTVESLRNRCEQQHWNLDQRILQGFRVQAAISEKGEWVGRFEALGDCYKQLEQFHAAVAASPRPQHTQVFLTSLAPVPPGQQRVEYVEPDPQPLQFDGQARRRQLAREHAGKPLSKWPKRPPKKPQGQLPFPD